MKTSHACRLIAVLCVGLAAVFSVTATRASIVENASRMMTAGDFDGDGINEVAYVLSSGEIFVHDFNDRRGSGALPGVTAQAVTAADLDGNGVPEIAFVNAATQQLQSYSAATQSFTTHPFPSGHSSFSTLSAGDVGALPGDELMVVASGVPFIRQTDGSYQSTPGSGVVKLASGELISGNAGDEFLVRNSVGAPYLYNYATNSYSSVGGSIDQVFAISFGI